MSAVSGGSREEQRGPAFEIALRIERPLEIAHAAMLAMPAKAEEERDLPSFQNFRRNVGWVVGLGRIRISAQSKRGWKEPRGGIGSRGTCGPKEQVEPHSINRFAGGRTVSSEKNL